MLNKFFRSKLVGAWSAVAVTIVAISAAMGASLWTTALLLILGVSPAIVMGLIVGGQPAPTVAQILHGGEAKDRR